jgi:hypothetical protein
LGSYQSSRLPINLLTSLLTPHHISRRLQARVSNEGALLGGKGLGSNLEEGSSTVGMR